MPFIPHTPESLIPRSDSRNPATTCKGITASGRPCRRSIGAPKASRNNGVLAVVSVASDSDDDDTGAAAYFCWQHKDQAEQLAAATPHGQDTHLYPLQERTSIDTLVARLGVLEVEEPTQPPRQKRRDRGTGDRTSNPRRINRPPTWDRVQSPLMSVPSDVMESEKRRSRREDNTRPQPRPRKPGFWVSLCCITAAEDDYVEVVRHKKRVQNQGSVTEQYSSESSMPQYPSKTHQSPARQAKGDNSPSYQTPTKQCSGNTLSRKPLGEKQAKPINKTVRSETSTLLSIIPKSLPPQTASFLLAELSKPISPHDDEGYIYIFWLTEETAGPPPSSTASSLLAPPSRPEQGRRTSDILRQYSVRSPSRPDTQRPRPEAAAEKKTILLKIGRASNVHRRMNEWTRQCGYSLSLVRFYPYVSTSSPSPSPRGSPAHSRRPSSQNQSRPSDPVRRVSDNNTVRKVPHAHRVERLIHIELADQRVRRDCEACGKEHREWFEVEATREGVKGVDEVVKRWVDWAERAGNDL